MANKNLQTRISLKIDTWANWNTAAGKAHVLKRGEIAFVQIGNDIPPIESTSSGTLTAEQLIKNPNAVLYKVGDGETTFENLKWGSAIAADVYDWAKAASVEYDATNRKIIFKNASDDAIGDGIDLSRLASDADLTALETRLTQLVNAGGTANQELAARVEAIEKAPYATQAFANTAAQNAANAVLTNGADKAGDQTVKGANLAAAAAQSAANANATAIQGINNTINSLDSTYAKDSELTAKANELIAEINKKANSDDVYDKTTANSTFATIDTVNGINSRVGANETAISNINNELAGLDAKFVDNDELAAGVEEAKDYTDEKIALVMDNSSDAVDSVMELAEAMKDNADAIDALNDIAATKASKTDFEAHVVADNPHSITPAKIGAYTIDEANNKFATLTAFESNKTTVKEATHAANADNATNATKATKDASGNVITDTYATKTAVDAIDAKVQIIQNDYLTEADFFYIDGGRAPTV